MDIPGDVAEAFARYGERLGMFAGRLHWHPRVTSTNDLALTLAEQSAAEGTVVAAELQTAGRGRQGRAWASPAGAGLYVSAVLRPPDRVAPLVTLAAGVALADGIRDATGLLVTLKWPNDVYVQGRKLAGILAEGGTSSAGVSHVVLGFGINLLPVALPPDVASRATSLELELGRPVDRGLVLAACLSALAQRYLELTSGDAAHVLDAWRTYAAPMLGRRVECIVGLQTISGVAEDIDAEGALLVRPSIAVGAAVPADPVRVISGEVLWQ
jgi:BirA family biotin operon repressor/biotin-[acetyl-CoA-carboxylase] ligase